jgi:hypothetical protein
MRGLCLLVGVLVASSEISIGQVRGGGMPLDVVRRSSDVGWLERIASSAAFAEQVQGSSPSGMAKLLRGAAYARLGDLASAEGLAAVERIEQSMAETTLVPITVPLGVWPSVAWHMSDSDHSPLATVAAPDGITYAVVVASLLGGDDLFLVSTRTPEDSQSWSRPKLIGPPARPEADGTASLMFRGAATLVLRGFGREVQFALDEIERDSDGDGWTDLEEGRIGTNPHAADSDGDGIPDGRDVCPLYEAPGPQASDDSGTILQKAIFAAFALTGAREMLYVTPSTPRIHVAGYGAPILFDRPIPRNGSSGGIYVSWTIRDRSAVDAVVEITDWEGLLSAGGQNVFLKKVLGKWVAVAVKETWVA